MDETEALALLASPFVDGTLFAAALGAPKDSADAVRLYLDLPVAGRPDLALYFDRAWYLLRHPDIAQSGADPLLHFLRWGLAEGRDPHPLIDQGFMRAADPALVPDPLSADTLLDLLEHDRVDPSPRFSRAFYRTQLTAPATSPDRPAAGLLRHFLTRGLYAGLRPTEAIDPIAAYRQARPRSIDIMDGLRQLALPDAGGREPLPEVPPEPPAEPEARALFLAEARALQPVYARHPIDFDLGGQDPAVSVVMVVHDRFALTMAALASLRASFAGPIELILVDSGSTDETRFVSQYLHGAHILPFSDNVGFLRGSNAGLQVAVAPAVLFLNNDIQLGPGAVAAALARLDADPSIGAVGARIVRSHGQLQEAGSIAWRNGETHGYLRDASPLAPEANFVRDVDFASGAFLMVRAALLEPLEGFDDVFAPAYCEDADLCLRIAAAGHRVIYDPAVLVQHLEYGSSSGRSAQESILENRVVFAEKNRTLLRTRAMPDTRAPLFARSTRTPFRRVLFIDDQIPLRRLGQGFVRSNDVIRVLARLGCHVTVFPLHPSRYGVGAIYADMPDSVEVMYDRRLADLDGFLKLRRGYYDTLWICRTHNLDQVKPVLERAGTDVLHGLRIILDTEAIAHLREQAKRRITNPNEVPERIAALIREFANLWFVQSAIAVNEPEAERLRRFGVPGAHILGHVINPTPTEPGPADRAGILFVGALAEPDSPNMDGLLWFITEVLPLLRAALGNRAALSVAGHIGRGVDLSALAVQPGVTLLGEVADLAPLYARHRVAIAPTRFAAGIPYKVHEAAAMGLPVVATPLLAAQLGWTDGKELRTAADPADFARAVTDLMHDDTLWTAQRSQALARVTTDCSPEAFEQTIRAIL